MKNRHFLLLIPLVAAFSFGMDIYVPFLVEVKHAFNADDQQIQLTLSAYMLALAAGQLIVGLLADIYGRKHVLIASGLLFTLASLGCALASEISWLIILRFIQGLGACGLRSAAYAVVKDHYDGQQATSKITYLYSIISLSPMIAPLLGGLIGTVAGWQSVFFFLTFLGIGIIICAWYVSDIYQPPKQQDNRWPFTFKDIQSVFTDQQILIYAFVCAAGITTLFCFVSSIAPIIQVQLALPQYYIYLSFCIVGFGMFLVGQTSGYWFQWFGHSRVFIIAYITALVCLGMLLLTSLFNIMSYPLYIVLMFVLMSMAILINGCAMGLGLAGRQKLVGLAIAIIGLISYSIPALLGWVISILTPTTTNYAIVCLIYYVIIFVMWAIYFNQQPKSSDE